MLRSLGKFAIPLGFKYRDHLHSVINRAWEGASAPWSFIEKVPLILFFPDKAKRRSGLDVEASRALKFLPFVPISLLGCFFGRS